MTTGLTLGKFAPLHPGHQLVIETALAEMDHVIVVIYPAVSVTSIPLPVRAGWITAIYPRVEVIEATDGPEETGYTPAIMATQERYLKRLLSGRAITAFYSSEPYGEHVSRALSCRNRTVDSGRNTYPISGTLIRQDLPAYLDRLDPTVRVDLIPRIVFLGGPSTGKTTIAKTVAELLGETVCREYGREYWFAHQVDHRLSMGDLEAIAIEQVRLEEETARVAASLVIADTSPLTTLVYARYYFGRGSAVLERIVDHYHKRPRCLILCDDDIPFDDSRDRSGPGSRERLQRLTVGELADRGLPYHLVSGTVERRRARVMQVIDHRRVPC